MLSFADQVISLMVFGGLIKHALYIVEPFAHAFLRWPVMEGYSTRYITEIFVSFYSKGKV